MIFKRTKKIKRTLSHTSPHRIKTRPDELPKSTKWKIVQSHKGVGIEARTDSDIVVCFVCDRANDWYWFLYEFNDGEYDIESSENRETRLRTLGQAASSFRRYLREQRHDIYHEIVPLLLELNIVADGLPFGKDIALEQLFDKQDDQNI